MIERKQKVDKVENDPRRDGKDCHWRRKTSGNRLRKYCTESQPMNKSSKKDRKTMTKRLSKTP